MDDKLDEFLNELPVSPGVSVTVLDISPSGEVDEDKVMTIWYDGVEKVMIEHYYIMLFLGEGGIVLYKHESVYNLNIDPGVTVLTWELQGEVDSKGERTE